MSFWTRKASRKPTASRSISACRPFNSTRARAAFPSAATVRSACAWTTTQGKTAADLVNTLSEDALADILRRYGEEKRARSIARAIVAARPITRTRELAGIAERVLGRGAQKIHPATRTFQALRIAVNDELGELERGLEAAERVLNPQGRLAVGLVPFARRPHRQTFPGRAHGPRRPRLHAMSPSRRRMHAPTFRPSAKIRKFRATRKCAPILVPVPPDCAPPNEIRACLEFLRPLHGEPV